MDLEQIKFNENGLVPVIVQDILSGQVLMLAYANKEALEKTIESEKSHFYSRSREKQWMKGEESGNVQEIKEIFYDCDMDTVLYLVQQTGVACHTGEKTCFYRSLNGEKEAPTFSSSDSSKTLDEVYEVILDRKENPKDGSYVSGLFEKGLDKILKKIGEEAGETIIGAKNQDKKEVVYETADLWFHSMITLAYFGLTPDDIYEELGRRFGKPKEAYRQES